MRETFNILLIVLFFVLLSRCSATKPDWSFTDGVPEITEAILMSREYNSVQLLFEGDKLIDIAGTSLLNNELGDEIVIVVYRDHKGVMRYARLNRRYNK